MSEEAQTPTKPTKTEETQKTQTHSRYETIRVPILRPSEYPIWNVKMAMFVKATDQEYLDRINEGPHKPTKLSVVVADQPAQTIPKEKGEYTAEDISSIAKNAKVKHLLHSAIDNVMSNRVIHCKTPKEIWEALETRCQRTDAIKKNRRTILTQEYEHFNSKADEYLTDLYDRFVKLLNDMSLVDKEYDLEDSNLKFLLALPENWDLKSTTIRDNYDLTETTLDEIYGMLKTYELEMDQRSKRHGRKSRTVALKAEEESPKVVASKRGKGKALIIKCDSESSYSDDDDSETESLPEMDADEEMIKLCALMVKGITKIAYMKFRKGKKFSRKSESYDKKGFIKSEGKGAKSDRGDNSNVKCYNCDERGHISPDCKKGKSDKGKTLITKKKSWTDTSDFEDEMNYSLMANADSSPEAAELKKRKERLSELGLTLADQPKMNGAKRSAEAVGCKNTSVGERSALEGSTRASGSGRSGSENVGLSNANIGPKIRLKGVVDGQQVNIPVLPLVGPEGRRRLAPECFSLCSYLLSGYTKKDVRSNEATMKYLLMGGASSSILVHGFSWLYGSSGGEIELQEIVNGLINTQMYNSPGISIVLIFITVGIGFKLSPAPSHQWTPDNLLSSGNWKEGLGYGDDKSEKGTEQIEPIVVKQTAKPKVNPVKFVAKTVKSDSEKMKESRTEVKEKSTTDKLEQDKPAQVNIGLMTKK
ncbi:hypothetical protein AgCh_004452 [Apium graveolens]